MNNVKGEFHRLVEVTDTSSVYSLFKRLSPFYLTWGADGGYRVRVTLKADDTVEMVGKGGRIYKYNSVSDFMRRCGLRREDIEAGVAL